VCFLRVTGKGTGVRLVTEVAGEFITASRCTLVLLANGEQKTMEERAKQMGILDLFDATISVKVYK
jgi:FMN phosphatase YigB (HAD superfamily)